jgi:hypothetical protein
VGAAAATHFAVSVPSSATAGAAFSFSVTALDAFNNTAAGYNGAIHFTSSDGASVLPANAGLNSGTGSFNATLDTAGNQTITATDTQNSNTTGTSNAVTVGAAAATHFAVTAPGSATAGSAFSFTVTALDPFNNTATSYNGTVHFTSSDGASMLPANAGLTSGTGSFNATLDTAGNQTITATDTQNSNTTGTSNAVTVGAAAAAHFAVTVPGSATAGTAVSITVTALDQFGNTATGYTGTVHFASSDALAVLPADAPLTNGTGTFGATLKTAGNGNITATDTQAASTTGASNAIAVSAAATTHFTVTTLGSVPVGAPFSITVTALDAFGNTAIAYAGTVHFTSTDSAAVLSIDSGLSNGVGIVSATFETGGQQTITATDRTDSSIQGVSASVTVNEAPSITSASKTTFTVESSGSFSVTTRGFPAVSITESGALPNGVTFHDRGDGTATITGTTTSFGRFPITFSAHNGFGADATQEFILTVSGIPAYAVTPNERFIAQVYLDLLNRFVEQPALPFWAGFLDQGMARSVIVLAIEQNGSNEYQTDRVQDLYEHYLHRAADPAGLQAGVAFLNGGGSDEKLAAILAGSLEYLQLRGNNHFDSFLNVLYQDTLARPIDPTALANDEAAIATNTITRAQLAFVLLTSQEYENNLVESAYTTFLHRSADPLGLDYFVQLLQAGQTDEQIIARLVGSTEYLQTRVVT